MGALTPGTVTPWASTTSTVTKDSVFPSAVMTRLSGVSVIARARPAVSTVSCATLRPPRVATAVSRPGANGTFQVRWSLPVLPFGLV